MMSASWARIIKRQYIAETITAAQVQALVPARITQEEADEILNAV